MNREQRLAHKKKMSAYPKQLTPLPKGKWPCVYDEKRKQVWLSRHYLVQLFDEKEEVLRISVNKTTIQAEGRWDDGLSWDELQQIKTDIGFANAFAVEIYPRAHDEVNVANMRHLWVFPEHKPIPDIGWRKGEKDA